jgi:hypothetical protein
MTCYGVGRVAGVGEYRGALDIADQAAASYCYRLKHAEVDDTSRYVSHSHGSGLPISAERRHADQ